MCVLYRCCVFCLNFQVESRLCAEQIFRHVTPGGQFSKIFMMFSIFFSISLMQENRSLSTDIKPNVMVGLGQLLWERLEFYFAMILNAFFIFSSTQLCVLRPLTMMKNKKIKTRLKLLQNKIPNAPIRVGLSGLIYSLFLLVGSVRMT